MGATHSHVCRAHSLFSENPKSNRAEEAKEIARVNMAAIDLYAETFLLMLRLRISLPTQPRRTEINIGPGLRLTLVERLRDTFKSAPKALCLVSNKRVFDLFGTEILSDLKREGFKTHSWLMPEGERYKSFRTLESLVHVLATGEFERNDAVIALGGGVVGDVAGLAASIYLRGIPFVQVPTTLLAQIDSSVGGKTGINLPTGKNLVGTFHQPELVIIDTQTLSSLPERELVAGFCEMVKQSLMAGDPLFTKTVRYLESRRNDFDSTDFQSLIRDHCKFKLSIVANDERESTGRTDAKSRRILNFGHTTAHALEAVTNYQSLRHGEAVGYGMLVAGEISKDLGLLSDAELESLRRAVVLCGPLPALNNIDTKAIVESFKHDKKRVAGEVNWVLLNGIGSPRIVNGKDINQKLLRRALDRGLCNPERSTSH
jgi:3-dehydroquinate synthase